jgi:hypothetical protein
VNRPSKAPRFRAGPLTADQLNALADVAEYLLNVGVGGDLVRTAGGNLFVGPRGDADRATIRLTGGGTGGLYDWVEVRAIAASPYWEETDLTGTDSGGDPAREANSNDSIDTTAPGPVVRAWREPGLAGWRFAWDECSS